jgi:hypothetical protein
MKLARLGDAVKKLRSKNAGPFWLTVDIFCDTEEIFNEVASKLSTSQVATTFGADSQTVKRFDIEELHVIKFSLPRPTTQGAIDDRDMHGASWAALLADVEI